MDIIAIRDAIEALEKDDTTVENVQKLSNLYIVYENIKHPRKTVVEHEYDDILPAYRKYCETKRQYQLDQVTEGAVIKDLKLVCTEISGFLHTLYSHTDMNRERKILSEMIETLHF